MYEELEKGIFEKVKEFLQVTDVNDEILRIDEKMFYFIKVRSAVKRERIKYEIEFKKKRSSYYKEYKFDSPIALKNVEIERVMWENDGLLKLAEKIETLKLIESELDIIINMFNRRAYALNTILKKEV